MVDTSTGKVKTLKLTGVKSPATATDQAPQFAKAKQVAVAPLSLKSTDGKIQLKVQLKLPAGWKINELAPMRYYTAATSKTGAVKRDSLGRQSVAKPSAEFDVVLPISGEGRDTVTVSMNYYYCQADGNGLCKMGSVVFTVPLEVNASQGQVVGRLEHQVAP